MAHLQMGLFANTRIPAHAERVGDPVDVVEPRRDQRDLENPAIASPLTPTLSRRERKKSGGRESLEPELTHGVS